MDLFFDPSQPSWLDHLYVTADWPDAQPIDTPRRHPAGGSLAFALPHNWATQAHDPACEMRVRGVNTYDGHPTPAGQIERGDEVWLGFSVMVPGGNVTGAPIIVAQFHRSGSRDGEGSGPCFALRLSADNRWSVRTRTASGAGLGASLRTVDYDTSAAAVEGVWTDFVFHLKFSLTDGIAEGWANGGRFLSAMGRTVGGVGADFAEFLKIGIYAPNLKFGSPPAGFTQHIVISALRYAPAKAGFDAVDPAQWPAAEPAERPIDRELLRALLAEGEDLAPQIADWLARMRAAVG